MAKVLGAPITSLNPYENFRDINRDSEWYDADRWDAAAKKGALALEADIIARGPSELGSYEDFVNKWHLDRASDNVFYAAATRELYADREKLNDYEEEVWNPETQKYETKKYQMTEYDWIGHQLQNWVDYDNYMIEQEQLANDKANRSWLGKLIASGAELTANFVSGFVDTIDQLGRVAYGTIAATGEAFGGKNWFDAYREATDHPSRAQEVLNAGEEYFAGWSYLRNADGSYTHFGQMLAQTSYTLGQMAPSVVANMVLPGVGLSANAAGKLSMGGYYLAMWSGRNTERFQNPDFASTPTWMIMLDSTIKTTTDILVEQGLRIFTGGTFMDKMLYGAGVRTASKGANIASKLGTVGRVSYRLAHDFVSEGLEEVLQDVFANISSQVESIWFEDFKNDTITMQSLMDTFLIAGMSSIIMTGVNIAFTPRAQFGDNKLGKLKSWLYISDYNNIIDTFETLSNNKNLSPKKRAALMKSAQDTFNIMTTVFRSMGDERVDNAIKTLNQIRQRAEQTPTFVLEDNMTREWSNELYAARSRNYVKSVLNSINELGNEFAKTKINKTSLLKRNKNKDGSTKRQTVAEKLMDAGVTEVHDFISKTNINDTVPQKGRSQKRVNLAKKVAKELDKDVAFTDGNNTVNAGDVQMIPGNYADNYEDAEVLRTIVENEFIDTLVAKLDRKILDRIRNAYRIVQKDKRRGTYEDVVRALLFDDDFFRVMFASANQDMYNFIAHIQDVLKAAKGKKVSDLMYEKVIENVLTRYKPIVREYVVNQQNADLTQLQNFFNDEEIREVQKSRWSLDLTNRILDQKEYKNLTEADNRVIENRINYMQVDPSIKEQIRKDLKSSSVSARTRALHMLDNQYRQMFFSKYNDRVYFEQTTPARNWFNQFIEKLGINLMNVRNGVFSKQFLDRMSKVTDENGRAYTDPLEYLHDQFATYTDNAYGFSVANGVVSVYQNTSNNIDTYTSGMMEYYNDWYGLMQMSMQEGIGVLVTPSKNIELMNKFIKQIVDGSKVNDINLAYTSINDIVQNPNSYLTTEQLMNIREDYGEVNNYTTFQYLRDTLLNDYETITLLRRPNGEIIFADMTTAYDSLVLAIKNAGKTTNSIFEKYVGKGPISISKFIDSKLLDPSIENYTIEFVNDPKMSAGLHNPSTQQIVINAPKNNAFTKFTILHEFQHAIQSANNIAGGMSPHFEVSDTLVQDFEKHLPQLFAKDAELSTKKELIRWFLYKTASGEVDANLFGDEVVFMQTLVGATVGDKTHIITPWGTEHNVVFTGKGQTLELPDYETGEILTIIDPKKYPRFYAASKKLLNNQDIDYEFEDQMRDLRREVMNISEVNNYYSQQLGQKPIAESIKKDLVNRVKNSRGLRDKMLHLMWHDIAPGMSFDEFLDTDVPFVRIQNNENTGNTIASSVLVGEEAFDALMRYTTTGISTNLYVGTIKPKDILAYIPGNTITEALLDYDYIKNADRFTVVKNNNQTFVVDNDNDFVTKAQDWYDGKIHINDTFKSDMQERVESLDRELQQHVLSGNYRIYDGTLNDDEAVWILPNGKAYVIVDFRDGVHTEYYLDFIIEVFNFNNEVTINLPAHITKDAFSKLNTVAKQLIKDHSIEVSISQIANLSGVENISDLTLSKDRPIDEQIKSYVELYNEAGDALYSISRNQDRLDIDDEQPKQERKRKQRRTDSKRGAHKRANSDRTYVSKSASKGTNLAAFAGRRIALDVQGFIMEASPTRLPGELWEKIENGTLRYYDVHRYFRQHEEMDEYTFQLIRKHFFPNAWFKTNEQLRKFTNLDIAFYYALQGVLYEAGLEVDANKPMSFDNFISLYNQISQNKSFKERLDEKAQHVFDVRVFDKSTGKFEYQDLGIDHNHLRVAAMELMDGSIDSVAHIIALARSIAFSYRYGEVWNTADNIKNTKSLQEGTTGHKADDAESGSLEDIIKDARTSKDMMVQALEEKIANSSYAKKLELLFEYFGDKLRKKNPDYKSWSDQKQRAAARAIERKIKEMSSEKFENLYRKLVAKQMGVNFTEQAIENNEVAKPVDRRKNIIASIKRFATTIKNYRSADQWKRVPDEYKVYFNGDGDLKQEVYAYVELKPDNNGNYPKLQEVQTKLGALAQGLRRGDFTTKAATTAFKQAQRYKELYTKQKETNKKLKNRYALVSDKKGLIIQSNSREFKATSDIAMPEKLRRMFDTQFEETRQSTIKFIAKPDDRQQIFNAKTFYDVNADILSNLGKDDVEEIIRFYDHAVLLEANESSIDRFKVFKIYLLAYFIDEARSGRWDIDSYYLERAEDILHTVTSSARELAAWRSVLGKVNPNKVIIQALATRLGVEVNETDVENLSDATKTGDVKKILKAQRELMRNALYRYKTTGDKETKNTKAIQRVTKKLTNTPVTDINDVIQNPEKYFDKATLKEIREDYGNTKTNVAKYVTDFVINNTNEIALVNIEGKYVFVDFTADKSSFMNKLLTFQKAAMLSSPATALRNQISNTFIEQGNKVAEFFGKFVSKVTMKVDSAIRKKLKKSPHNYAVEQIDLTGVKVTDEVKNFIQTQVIDTGVFEFISEGASKYDTRKSRTYTGMDVMTDMVVNNIINEITRGNTYNHDLMNAVIQTIFKWQSDNRYINRTARSYLGKLLTVDKVDLSKGLSEEVMTNIAEAYKLAAFDYMHKTNVASELENKLRERAPKIYAGYKMVFPFIPTSWNWFMESINWSPVGLVKNIVQLCRIEKTIDKIVYDRQKGRSTYDPRLVQYVISRNIGKGVIGSFLMGLGMLFGGLGWMQVDDDDDKLKIKIGDVYFNINNVFGTSSIILGAELMNPREGSVSEVLEAAFGAITEDAWLNDIADMFSYGADSVWDILLDKPTDILGTFVPNFLKSLNKLLYTHEVKYASGFLGNLEYLAASSIPFLAYAFPKKIDPFTGEVQSKYGLPFAGDFLTDLVNVASPVQVKPHKVSKYEKIAIELGLNKQPLTGEYDDVGKVDYTILNMKYGQLNETSLSELINNKFKYTVEDENGKQKELFWRQMSEKQKKAVIERIMSNNSRYAKIFTWTQMGHKYYASNSEYTKLKKLGITKNIFKGDKGFVS